MVQRPGASRAADAQRRRDAHRDTQARAVTPTADDELGVAERQTWRTRHTAVRNADAGPLAALRMRAAPRRPGSVLTSKPARKAAPSQSEMTRDAARCICGNMSRTTSAGRARAAASRPHSWPTSSTTARHKAHDKVRRIQNERPSDHVAYHHCTQDRKRGRIPMPRRRHSGGAAGQRHMRARYYVASRSH
jgi:hypothetical protein